MAYAQPSVPVTAGYGEIRPGQAAFIEFESPVDETPSEQCRSVRRLKLTAQLGTVSPTALIGDVDQAETLEGTIKAPLLDRDRPVETDRLRHNGKAQERKNSEYEPGCTHAEYLINRKGTYPDRDKSEAASPSATCLRLIQTAP